MMLGGVTHALDVIVKSVDAGYSFTAAQKRSDDPNCSNTEIVAQVTRTINGNESNSWECMHDPRLPRFCPTN